MKTFEKTITELKMSSLAKYKSYIVKYQTLLNNNIKVKVQCDDSKKTIRVIISEYYHRGPSITQTLLPKLFASFLPWTNPPGP